MKMTLTKPHKRPHELINVYCSDENPSNLDRGKNYLYNVGEDVHGLFNVHKNKKWATSSKIKYGTLKHLKPLLKFKF